MSAMDIIPEDIRRKIESGELALRDDLRIIPEAEAAGWTVTFRDGHWHNNATFNRGDVWVWYSIHKVVAWRSARLREGRYQDHQDHLSLRVALGL